MVTKEEFKQLKEKYWTKEYGGKVVIITNNLPEKLIIIVPYDSWNRSDVRHHIIEISKCNITYYGCNGNQIKGRYTNISWYQANGLIIEGKKSKDKIEFFTAPVQNNDYIDFRDLQVIFYTRFVEFIKDLKRNKIEIAGLSKYMLPYITVDPSNRVSTRYYFMSDKNPSNNIIEQLFGLKPKDLREFRENYKGIYIYDFQLKFRKLKQLFNCSAKDICKYISVYDYVNNGCLCLPLQCYSKEQLKDLRIEFRYLSDLEEAQKGSMQIYRDYRRCLKQFDETNRKKWPLYPKDFSKIQKLHDDAIDFLNKERDRIQAAKQVEKQTKYLENFYKKAKALEMSNDTYSIIACKDLMDLVKEGRSLSHCVGSYINSVSEGWEYILFLRKNESIDTPYFTIDVTPTGNVRQIHGFGNCNITKEIKPFVETWAKKFKLDISNCSGCKCALS